ncbi:MAG: assimilatory sulfite reductase (NADPH) flavoprotein subunit [Myxococcaceae bacterium]
MTAVLQTVPVHADEKELLRLAVVGSVDDGKSTLIGRLLYECDGLFDDQLAAVKRATARRATDATTADAPEEIDFAFFTDGLRAEREQGITIDVAYRYFSTARRKIIVADTPGHLQYTRNMATGASTADAAVILVDARLGVLPQTRRHAYIASLLGIPYLAVAVNKMDLVGFDPAVFTRIGAELEGIAQSLGFSQVRLFPVSARAGDNITRPSPRTPWHRGGTLLGWLESLPHQHRQEEAPFRFPVQYVLRPDLDYRGFAGQIASGTVHVGDEVVALPSGRRTRIAGIDTFHGPLTVATAPASITLRLQDELDLSRGDLLAPADQPPRALERLEAMLVWFGERPLVPGQRYLVKHTTRTVSAQIDEVLWRKELEDLSEVPAETLALNDIGRVRIACKRPLLCDPYAENRRTGALIVIDPATNDTVAAGMIVGPADQGSSDAVGPLVTGEERRARLGQLGAVVLLPTHRDAEQDAYRLERQLFDKGVVATVVAGDPEVAVALAETGVIALTWARSLQARRGLLDQLRSDGVVPIELAEKAEDAWLQQLTGSKVPAVAVPTTPLGPEKEDLLRRLVEGLDSGALTWLSGYVAGRAAVQPAGATSPAASTSVAAARLTIVYGTQTGNSRALAERLSRDAEAAGLSVRVLAAGRYPLRELEKERLLYLVVSTQGDGEPPDDARGFCDFVLGKRAPKLAQLSYAVLALGDSSYPKYCEIGRALDQRLEALGAKRLQDRADCDVDYEPAAQSWIEAAITRARESLGEAAQVSSVTSLRTQPPSQKRFHRDAPFQAEVLANQRITGRGALKDIRHFELSLAESGLSYEPGDALGFRPRNPPALVSALLDTLGFDAAAEVTRDGRTFPMSQWLAEELEITRVSRPVLTQHASLAHSEELEAVLAPENAEAFAELLRSHQLIDVLRRWPGKWTQEAFVGALRRLTPRLYSIASSQKRVGAEVHLTVAVVDYTAFGSRHFGAASWDLATRRPEERIPVFIEPNERFRLPADGSRDILMIGPGTGVAPFRAFVQERAEVGASGRNWLFFGEQHFRTQFHYQAEWQEALRQGHLHRLSVAFSRDQAERIYVQHRLREAGHDVFDWLERGASVYVCGDAQGMAPDVHAALVDIISKHGQRSREDAEAYLDGLREQHRYQRDVY